MMKFRNERDAECFQVELVSSGIDEVLFIRNRTSNIKKLKDFRKSQTQRANWRAERWKYLQGIRTFHKSTQGKDFHRKLGRYLATRIFRPDRMSIFDYRELTKSVSSALTHAVIETQYYMDISEAVDYEIFYDEVFQSLTEVLSKIQKYDFDFSESDVDLLVRVAGSYDLKTAIATVIEKDIKEVTEFWNREKAKLDGKLKSQNMDENSDGYYAWLLERMSKEVKANA